LVGIEVSTGNNIQVYGNVIYSMHKPPTAPPPWMGCIVTSLGASNTKIYNNTCYDSDAAGVYVEHDTGPGTIIKNNIAYMTQNGILDTAGTAIISNNLTTNPSFVDPANANFRLQSGSPAIDNGVTISSITTDISGVPLPQGCCYDIGAYEY
jgi:hypothetical protein